MSTASQGSSRPRVSPRKIEANRRNALRSTGPKTEAGKQTAKWNALKHGMLAKEVVINAGPCRENPRELHRLLAHLRQELQPVGVLEEMLVEKIAVGYWRLRRVLRCENGEIRRRGSTVTQRSCLESVDGDNPGWSSSELQALIEKLEDVREEVQQGAVSGESHEWLIEHFGTEFNLPDATPDGRAVSVGSAEDQKRLLELLDARHGELLAFRESVVKAEELALKSTIASSVVPPRKVVDRLLRYETAIERQLHRDLSQLERLQRLRGGDFVPPPVRVDVSGGS